MANWGMRVLGIVVILAVMSSMGMADSSVSVRFAKGDSERLPEIVYVDSLIAEYAYDRAEDTLYQLLRNSMAENSDSAVHSRIIIFNRLGFASAANGYYDSAITCYRRAEALIEGKYGKESTPYAELLVNLGHVHEILRHDSTAVDMYTRAYHILSGHYPEGSHHLLTPLFGLSQMMILSDSVDSSQALLMRAGEIIDESANVSFYHLFEYNYLWGDQFYMIGEFDSSDARFARAADIAREHLGELSLAKCYQDWSYMYDYLQMAGPADSLSREALKIGEKILRPEHPQLAILMDDRAAVMSSTHEFSETVELLNRAETIVLNTLGDHHPRYATILAHKAKQYEFMRDYSNALLYNKKHLDCVREIFGTNSMQYISSVGTLATIYLSLYDYEKALPLMQKYSDFYYDRDGDKSISYLNAASYLAYSHYLAGNYRAAESAYVEILPLVADVYGPDNKKTGEVSFFLGMSYYARGKYSEAESAYLRALRIYQDIMVSYNPSISGVLSHLAIVYGVMGDYDKSLSYYRRLLANRNTFLSGAYTYASIDQKIRYLSAHPILMHSLYSLALKAGNTEAVTFAFEMLVRGKALSLDAIAAQNRLARCTDDSLSRSLFESLQENSNEIASLTYTLAGKDEIHDYKDVLDSLFAAKQTLESRLSSRCDITAGNVFNSTIQLQDIINHLPENSVLLDFAKYEPYDFDSSDATYRLFGESRYLVFVLDKTGHLDLFDLGSTAEIDSIIAQSRSLIEQVPSTMYGEGGKEAEAVFGQYAAELFDMLIAPYYDRVSSVEQWLISGDGGLNLLPFETLVLPEGRYLVEEHEISYLSSARDVMQYVYDDDRRPQSMALYYQPDYNSVPAKIELSEGKNERLDLWVSGESARPFLRGRAECLNAPFSRLNDASEEAEAIANSAAGLLADGISRYSGKNATEYSLKYRNQTADIYHFATHGFICPKLQIQDVFSFQSLFLQSGLALTGANRRLDSTDNAKSDDGILTAFEISDLDFDGVDLVTLSACETGLGETIAGEGVFGFRRAFQQAGARTLLMSLRKVPDKECAGLMAGFYSDWLVNHDTKSSALRKATLRLLKQSRQEYGNGHPFFWSGFILLGNPY